MRTPRLPLLAAAVLVLGLTACSGSSDAGSSSSKGGDGSSKTTTTVAATEAQEYTGDDDGFYEVPDPIPSDPHGTLVRYQVLDDVEYPGATTYRIMYTSESIQGDPIVVTGLASVPTAEAPADGRPMVTISHGTTGIADQCAPSKTPEQGSEMTLVGAKLGSKFLVAATDDEGLGTPGRHPYLVGESEGRSAIDAILAAGELPDAHPGDQLGIVGYSQGGHGAVWTSQVAKEWAPDLEVVGTFAGAPASETDVILKAAAHVPGVAGFAYMIIAGIHAAYPEADLSTFLTPKGIEVLDVVDEGCTGDVFAAVGGYPVDELLLPDSGTAQPWVELGEENNAGQEKTNDAPTLIIRSSGDNTVPATFADRLEARMCANDQVVERQTIDGGGHGEAAIPAYDIGIPWLEARFAADAPAPKDTCPEAAPTE